MRWYWATALLLVTLGVPRLLHLGTIITIDEPLWLDRGRVFIERISTFQFSDAIPSIQPGVTTAWLTGLTDHFDSLAASQSAIAIVSIILVLTAVYFFYYLWGPQWAFIAGFLLALDPFLIAHSRVAHTDALLALFLLNSTVALLAFNHLLSTTNKPHNRLVFYSGVFLGLGVLTKVFALALVPVALGLIAIGQWKHPRAVQNAIRVSGIWVTASLATIFLLWPAMWSDPIALIQTTYQGISQYSGDSRTDEITSQWWYYPREALVRLTLPITLLIPFTLIGLYLDRKQAMSRSALLLLACGLLYAFVLSLKGERSDRYILFTLLTIITTATVGIKQLSIWLGREWPESSRRFPAIIAGIILIYLAIVAMTIHPYYLAHHNRLYAIKTSHKLGWGEGLEQAAVWVSVHYPNVPVASYYPRVFSYFYTGNAHVESLSHIPESRPALVVLYRSMFGRGKDAPETDLVNEYLNDQTRAPIHIIEINGLPFVWIFEALLSE